MVDDIRCEVLPRANKRTDPIPVGYYPIVADVIIDEKKYEFCDIFKGTVPVDESKKLFAKSVLSARNRTMDKKGM